MKNKKDYVINMVGAPAWYLHEYPDGRDPDIPWREQNISTIGYHYYMTPETAQRGLEKLPEAIKTKPKDWKLEEWPDLSNMDVFK